MRTKCLIVWNLLFLFLNVENLQNILRTHYEKTPIQYTVIFHGCKKDYFQMKKFDIFLIFAQNIDLGYTLEPRF